MAPKTMVFFQKGRRVSSSDEEDVLVDLVTNNGTHSFLYFGNIKPVGLKKSIKSRLRRLKNKPIMSGKVVDWKVLEYLGQKEAMQNILARTVEIHGETVFCCRAWENVMSVREDMYVELCKEFFASFSINKTITGYYDKEMLTFRLGGGGMRFMSLADFAVAIGLYTEEQMESPIFSDYIAACEREQLDDFNFEEAWIELGFGKYRASLTKAILIRDPHLRLIHRMIVHSINGRGNGQERISRRDLWLLYQVSDSSRYIDVAYSLALYLQEANETRDISFIVGGQYVTRLADHLGILTRRVRASLTPVNEMGWINLSDMRRMWVAHYADASRSTTVWGDDRDLFDEESFETPQAWEENRSMNLEEAIQQLPQSSQAAQRKRPRTARTELDYQVKFNDLSLRIDRLQESLEMMYEMQRRSMYDLYRVLHQHRLDNQMVASWLEPSVPPSYIPQLEQLPQWEPQHLNPPHPTPYDQWIRRPDGN